LRRVLQTLDYVASAPQYAALPEKALLAHYLGTKANLTLGLSYLEGSRAAFLAFAAAT